MKLNLIIIIFFFLFLSCKDPVYQKCDNLCTTFNQCVKDQFKSTTNSLESNKHVFNKFYANCIDACMIYNIEIFECMDKDSLSAISRKEECSKIFDCTMPVFLNQ